jgi:hypothetical protein
MGRANCLRNYNKFVAWWKETDSDTFPILVDATNIPAFNPAAEGEQENVVKKLYRSNGSEAKVLGIVSKDEGCS